MIYFGQEVGEPGGGVKGYGREEVAQPSMTTGVSRTPKMDQLEESTMVED